MPAHCDAVLRRHFWFWAEGTYNQSANLNSPAVLLGMHMTSVGRGCNMVLDMSPTPTGLLQTNDVETYAGFGDGQQVLYNHSQVAAAPAPARGQAVVEVLLPTSQITRGAIELRENLTMGQAIESYNISHSADGKTWLPLPLRNEMMLTIGNRRIQYWDGVTVGPHVRVEVQTLVMASGQRAVPHIRSVRLMDWGAPVLDTLLSSILTVP